MNWKQMFLTAFFVMVVIYLVKYVTGKVKIPVVSDIAQGI